MTLELFIQGVEQLLTVIALIGVIWSAVAFVFARRAENERDRESRLAGWRKLAVHQLLMHSQDFLTTDQIADQLRAQSFDSDLEIRKAELSKPVVRQILIELVNEGVLGQVFPDKFGVVQLPRDITIGAVADDLHARYAARAAFREIYKHPNRFSSEELFGEVTTDPPMELSDFILSLLNLENHGAAKRSANGKWFPMTHKEEA